MNPVEHAKAEFKVLDWPGDEESQGWICENILELLEVFSKQGHSGSSAPYLINLFSKLASFDPISPLTGEDSEWNEVGEGVFQNNRCSEVFKQADRFGGKPYWIHGKVFHGLNGCTFTNSDSHVTITFPWTKPESEIIDIEP